MDARSGRCAITAAAAALLCVIGISERDDVIATGSSSARPLPRDIVLTVVLKFIAITMLLARVIETRRLGDRLWLNVEVLNHSLCDAGAHGPPETIARGWLPAHAAEGEPAVWFASRGC